MKQILCFGDSNTYGLVPGTGGRYEWGIRWTSIVDERMHKWGYRVAEEGLCGRTTVFDDICRKGRRGTELLPVLLEVHNPIDIIVLMLGTNDCKTAYHATAERIGEGIEALLEQIDTFNPEIQVLLVSPIALGSRVWEEAYDVEFNQHSVDVSKELPKVYASIAQKRGIEFVAASDYAEPSSTDQEHMDMRGHRQFAEAILNKLESMIIHKAMIDGGQQPYYRENVS